MKRVLLSIFLGAPVLIPSLISAEVSGVRLAPLIPRPSTANCPIKLPIPFFFASVNNFI